MIDYELSDLFSKQDVDKQILIQYDTGRLTNNETHSEKFTLEESICSGTSLRFGACESSVLKFTASNVFESLKGKWLDVSTILGGNTDKPFQFGKFKVYSDVPTADRNNRDVVAYDVMYDILNSDVSSWYKSLKLPMTLKKFRDSFCEYLNVGQEEYTLINDSMTVLKTIDPEELSGKDVIEAICEVNGCFGHIGNNGKLKYIVLNEIIDGQYPSETTYPSEELYPAEPNTYQITRNKYISVRYEDYIVEKITGLQIRKEENDIGVSVGSEDNVYVIQDNFLLYGKSANELKKIAENILGLIKNIAYRPAEIECNGNPCLEPGDGITIHTKKEIVQTYIMSRTISGVQNLKDKILASGEQHQEKAVNSIRSKFSQLKGKTAKLEADNEHLSLEFSDFEETTNSKFEATAKEISLRVTSDEVQSMIDVALDKITISASQISLEGYTTINGGFSITEDGTAILEDVESSTFCMLTSYGLEVGKQNYGYINVGPQAITVRPERTGAGYLIASIYNRGVLIGDPINASVFCKTLNGEAPVTQENINELEQRINSLENILSGASWNYLQLQGYDGDEYAYNYLTK